MRTTLILLALTASAAAQPEPAKRQDRHPAYANDPAPAVRVVPIEVIHSFEQRWEPVWQLMSPADRLRLHPSTASVGLPADPEAIPAPRVRPPAKVADRGTGLCERHGMTKVYVSKHQWRCR